MSIDSIGSSAALGADPTSSAGNAAGLSDRFMKLLVAQLQNQDPLNPMDNSQMTSQMAQLSSLQELTKISGLLESGGAAGSSSGVAGLAQAAAALGRTAQVKLGEGGVVASQGGLASVGYDFGDATPFKATLVATDPTTGELLGSWPMTGSKGSVELSGLPKGAALSVQATDASGKPNTAISGYSALTQQFKVNQTVLSNGAVYVQAADGTKAPWSSVQGLST